MSRKERENDSEGEVSRGRTEHDTVSPFSVLIMYKCESYSALIG